MRALHKPVSGGRRHTLGNCDVLDSSLPQKTYNDGHTNNNNNNNNDDNNNNNIKKK